MQLLKGELRKEGVGIEPTYLRPVLWKSAFCEKRTAGGRVTTPPPLRNSVRLNFRGAPFVCFRVCHC